MGGLGRPQDDSWRTMNISSLIRMLGDRFYTRLCVCTERERIRTRQHHSSPLESLTGMPKPPPLLHSRIWHNPTLVHTNKSMSQTQCPPGRLHNIKTHCKKGGSGFSDPDPRGTAHAGFLLPHPKHGVVPEINVKHSSHILSKTGIKNMLSDSAC